MPLTQACTAEQTQRCHMCMVNSASSWNSKWVWQKGGVGACIETQHIYIYMHTCTHTRTRTHTYTHTHAHTTFRHVPLTHSFIPLSCIQTHIHMYIRTYTPYNKKYQMRTSSGCWDYFNYKHRHNYGRHLHTQFGHTHCRAVRQTDWQHQLDHTFLVKDNRHKCRQRHQVTKGTIKA